MMKKSNLWMLALIPIVFLIVLFAAASASKSNTPDQEEEIVLLDEETELQTENEEIAEGDVDAPSESLVKDDVFAFTVGGFSERFSDSLPQGYLFADEAVENSQQNGRMQVDILDETGTPIDIAIVFDAQQENSDYGQMALIIKEDSFKDDVAAVLQWYLNNFLDGFEKSTKERIYEDYLDMFDSKAEDYRVYSEGILTVMMFCETEEKGKFYYILMSVQ